MWYIDRLDHAGHGFGYYPYAAEYHAALKVCDDEIGGVLNAIASRKTFAEEDWLVVVTADHGGWERYHGQLTTQCYTIPFIVAGRRVAQGRVPGVPHNYDAAPTALPFFIGQDGTGRYKHPFVGDVDDVAIWTRTLTHGEVRRIWEAGRFGKALNDIGTTSRRRP